MSAVSATSHQNRRWFGTITSRVKVANPALIEWASALATSILLILSFPNFELAPLAWIALVPLLIAIARRPSPLRALILGWAAGTIFFYGTCYWLTYSIIHYGGLPTVVAYLLLIPGAIVIGIFPGIFAAILTLLIHRRGPVALLVAPMLWVALEYARLGITGQLWNAIGYSQAYTPELIQAARWGGVYGVGFLIVAVNSALACFLLRRTKKQVLLSLGAVTITAVIIIVSLFYTTESTQRSVTPYVHVVALQPNVPMTLVKTTEELQQLLERHLSLSSGALAEFQNDGVPRFVIWPESPMNFTYASDQKFQQVVTNFALQYRASILFNSLEPAPGGGSYNSAVLINDQGQLISQYDKIRLLPFGEYVPLPRWLPGASLITAIVGDFTPGANYTLMPIANHRAGVFICVESAYPSIARALTVGGADVLINISNDGYLGPTAVMRQHLANAVFRAVENGRPVLRVTNTGITARIRADGLIEDDTRGFQIDVRKWSINEAPRSDTFYSRHGDRFVQTCGVVSVLVFILGLIGRRRSIRQPT